MAQLLACALTLLSLCGSLGVAHADEPPAPEDAQVDGTAQPTPKELARARRLFQRGVEFAARGEYSPAAKRFREALAIRPASAIEYNLASALYEMGSYQEAYNRTQSVLRAADVTPDVRTRAERLERALQPYVARLTVFASGSAEGLVIRVDGTPVDPALHGVTQAVQPGTHVIATERDGGVISQRDVKIPVRTAALVDVSLIATPEQAAATVAAEESQPAKPLSLALDEERDPRHPRRNLRIWASVGAAVVAVGVGVTLGMLLTKDDPAAEKPVPGDAGVLTWK